MNNTIDQQKMNLLLKENEQNVRNIAKNLYISGGTEEDLVQEGMIGFAQGAQKYDQSKGDIGSESFKAFALMCAKRRMLDAIRHAGSKKHSPLSSAVPLDGTLPPLDQFAEGPEDIFINKHNTSEKLNSVCFSAAEKQVIELLLDGYDAQSIGQKLGKSKKAVEDVFYRLRKKIKGE